MAAFRLIRDGERRYSVVSPSGAIAGTVTRYEAGEWVAWGYRAGILGKYRLRRLAVAAVARMHVEGVELAQAEEA